MNIQQTSIAAAVALAGTAIAGTSYDANVTGDVIFGRGNANGGFTVSQQNGVEIGLRAKLRFNNANEPENTYNSNGDGSYTFRAGLPPAGFDWAPGSTSSATWNFEWSVNSDFAESTGNNLSDFTYLISIDFDPSAGTQFLAFDPITLQTVTPDHAIGDNNTANGAGQRGTDAASYQALLDANNIAQNSWNMEFFDGGAFPFDARAVGEYTIKFEVFDTNGLVASNSININVVPMPAASAMAGLGLIAVGTRRRR